MYTMWTQHLDNKQEKIDFEKTILGSKRILNRLRDILKEQEDTLDRTEVSPSNYETPNWAYKQAHCNGFRQCINFLKKLIDLDQQLPTMEDTNERDSVRRPRQSTANRSQ